MRNISCFNPLPIIRKNYIKYNNLQNVNFVDYRGSIDFYNSKMAENYAKEIILKALKSKEPHEKAVILHGGSILGVVKGDKTKVHIPEEYLNYKQFLTVMHGHPSSFPLSINDYILLMQSDNINVMIAYNTDGSYSKFTKLKQPKYFLFSDFLQKRLLKKRVNFLKQRLGSIVAKHRTFIHEKSKQYKNDDPIQYQEILDKRNKELIKRMHLIWELNAKQLGIKYETYSL